jgi:hypothetical protein
MIIVFSDDQTVSVLPDIDSVRRECEAADVEDGVYRFFDESGRQLLVHWISFVERRSLFGGNESVGGGRFELELDPKDDGSGFEVSLSNVVALAPNPTFETIEDLADYVSANRR